MSSIFVGYTGVHILKHAVRRYLLSMVQKLEDDAESQPARSAALLEAASITSSMVFTIFAARLLVLDKIPSVASKVAYSSR